MEVLFIIFAFVSTSVLGLLCLIVLEYQNSKARRWNRLWIDRRPGPSFHPTPMPLPGSPNPVGNRPIQEILPFVFEHKALDAAGPLS